MWGRGASRESQRERTGGEILEWQDKKRRVVKALCSGQIGWALALVEVQADVGSTSAATGQPPPTQQDSTFAYSPGTTKPSALKRADGGGFIAQSRTR